jgi:GTP-binding protein
MLIDDITIKVKAGDGGNGAVAFNKNLMSLGPVGGSGGNGGDVIFEGVSDLLKLNQFRFKKELDAENGHDGRGQFIDGRNGKDLTVQIPVGTVILNEYNNETQEITLVGEKIIVAQGGRGGRGNFQFRSPTNTTPKRAEDGRPGESFTIKLELKMIADVGFVGLPNAGKTSLLNELTRAKAKVGNYAFTTLEPNLGAYYDLIIADIPGLIEGASAGKGLGAKFLRHIERTKEIFHLVSAESQDPIDDYKIIRAELSKYGEELASKPEKVFLSKSDLLSQEEISLITDKFKKINIDILPITNQTEEGLLAIKESLSIAIKNKLKN